MKMKLNAEIILNVLPISKRAIHKNYVLTKEEKGCVALLVEQVLNNVSSVILKSASLMIGIRVHIKDEVSDTTISEPEEPDNTGYCNCQICNP